MRRSHGKTAPASSSALDPFQLHLGETVVGIRGSVHVVGNSCIAIGPTTRTWHARTRLWWVVVPLIVPRGVSAAGKLRETIVEQAFPQYRTRKILLRSGVGP